MMSGYFVQFLAYTFAMVGFLAVCLVTYKKFCQPTMMNNSAECLCIENALRLTPKKQIYVVRAGKERFLVASDAETTTMLAKLGEGEQPLGDENVPPLAKVVANIKNENNVVNNEAKKVFSFKIPQKFQERKKA